MGLFDSIKAKAERAIKDATRGEEEEQTRAPEDPEEYAKKLSESIDADVRMFSGCMDSQTSADVHDVSKFGLPNADGAGGACTNALLLTLSDSQPDSWLSLLKGMRSTLKTKRFSQVPQLSTSRQIDVNDSFGLMNPEASGNTKALLIGINYVGQQGELAGCHNDAVMMKEFIGNSGYDTEPEKCMMLMDDGEHASPTREAIMDGFKWLIDGAAAGDSLFMHYSGHGGYTRDTSGDEADNMDETLVPVDYQSAGQIKDDEILKELVMMIPEGVVLTVVMDCCHSGSILDLPYAIKADEGTIEAVEAGEAPSTVQANPRYSMVKMMKIAKELYSIFQGGGLDMTKLGKLASLAMS